MFALCVCVYACEVCLRMCARLFCVGGLACAPKRGLQHLFFGVLFFAKIPANITTPQKNWKTKNTAETKTLRNVYADYVVTDRSHNKTLNNRCGLECEASANGSGSAKNALPSLNSGGNSKRQRKRARERERERERERAKKICIL